MPSFPHPGAIKHKGKGCIFASCSFLSLCSCLSPCGLETKGIVFHIPGSHFPSNCSLIQAHLVGVMQIDWSYLRCNNLNYSNVCLIDMFHLDDVSTVSDLELRITASLMQSHISPWMHRGYLSSMFIFQHVIVGFTTICFTKMEYANMSASKLSLKLIQFSFAGRAYAFIAALKELTWDDL